MSPSRAQAGRPAWGFPRVSGDEPCNLKLVWLITKFSPRERG